MSTDKEREQRKETRRVDEYLGEKPQDKTIYSQIIESSLEKGRVRHGSPLFYSLLQEMADTHDRKSHDYASNSNPFGNYHFAGKLALLFAHSAEDAGFAGRIGEKLFRLANLESSDKTPQNESIEDTERDIAVIATLWMADRRQRRWDAQSEGARQYLAGGSAGGGKTDAMAEQVKAIKGLMDKGMETHERSAAACSAIISCETQLTVEGLKEMAEYLQSCLTRRTQQLAQERMARG